LGKRIKELVANHGGELRSFAPTREMRGMSESVLCTSLPGLLQDLEGISGLAVLDARADAK
jgi:hypothetical protein